jgi:glucosamine-6-phosphate deaminase
MNQLIPNEELYKWCKIPFDQLESHPDRKVPFRLVKDSVVMGILMAAELVNEIAAHNKVNKNTRAIIPCGPACWYKPFTDLVNAQQISLRKLEVFHMDECLDWQGLELSRKHPYSFRGFMETHFYGPVKADLCVPEKNRFWLNAMNTGEVKSRIEEAPIDITYGGWGQDGHIAYNQTRRHPFSHITINDLKNSSIRIQENNLDTIIALAHRTFGAAYQFVPPMSVTLGIKECLSAKKVRLFSDTGSWKQTALRVALFGPVTPEYPITLCQEHPDAMLTATISTASHPISENPDWELLPNQPK